MTGELTTLFEGKEIRTLERQGEPWFPVSDLAIAWGLDRTTPLKILTRNEEAFRGFVCIASQCDKMSPSDEGLCVNERGLYLMIGKITTGKLKNRNAASAILRFQRWVPELIQKYRKNEIQPQKTWSIAAIECVDFAKALLQVNPQLDPGMCMAIGIREAERVTGKDLSAYKKLITPAPENLQEEYITATQIGREIGGRTANEINRYLERTGFVYRGNDGVLYLTNAGALHGKVFPGAFESGHCGYYIKWKRSIVAAAKMRENNPTRIIE